MSMFEKFIGWLGVSIGFMFAIAVPLLLAGVSREAVWPIALVCAALLFIARPGGNIQTFLGFLFTYGIIFSVWCVAGFMVVIVLGLFFSDMRPPLSLFIVAGVGGFGVVRELNKSNSTKVTGKPNA